MDVSPLTDWPGPSGSDLFRGAPEMSLTAHVLQIASLLCAFDALIVLALAAGPRADETVTEVLLQSSGGLFVMLAIVCAAAGGLA